MSAKTKSVKALKTCGGIFIGFILLIGLIVRMDPVPSTPEPTTTTSVEVETPPEVTPTPEFISTKEQIQIAINDLLGSKTNEDKDRFIDVSFYQENGVKGALVEYNADINLTNNLTKAVILDDAQEFFEEVAPQFEQDIGMIRLHAYLDLTDASGNTSNQYVTVIGLKRETWENVNWEDFTISNFPYVADVYWQSPIFSE